MSVKEESQQLLKARKMRRSNGFNCWSTIVSLRAAQSDISFVIGSLENEVKKIGTFESILVMAMSARATVDESLLLLYQQTKAVLDSSMDGSRVHRSGGAQVATSFGTGESSRAGRTYKQPGKLRLTRATRFMGAVFL